MHPFSHSLSSYYRLSTVLLRQIPREMQLVLPEVQNLSWKPDTLSKNTHGSVLNAAIKAQGQGREPGSDIPGVQEQYLFQGLSTLWELNKYLVNE